METTMRKMIEKEIYPCSGMMEYKRRLLSFKKTGLIFFENEISNLELDTKIHLYLALMPGEETLVNAFPIPKREFKLIPNKDKFLLHLRRHYINYYDVRDIDSRIFYQYNLENPYRGKEFVWYYKVSH